MKKKSLLFSIILTAVIYQGCEKNKTLLLLDNVSEPTITITPGNIIGTWGPFKPIGSMKIIEFKETKEFVLRDGYCRIHYGSWEIILPDKIELKNKYFRQLYEVVEIIGSVPEYKAIKWKLISDLLSTEETLRSITRTITELRSPQEYLTKTWLVGSVLKNGKVSEGVDFEKFEFRQENENGLIHFRFALQRKPDCFSNDSQWVLNEDGSKIKMTYDSFEENYDIIDLCDEKLRLISLVENDTLDLSFIPSDRISVTTDMLIGTWKLANENGVLQPDSGRIIFESNGLWRSNNFIKTTNYQGNTIDATGYWVVGNFNLRLGAYVLDIYAERNFDILKICHNQFIWRWYNGKIEYFIRE